MKKLTFERDAQILTTITSERLTKAKDDEEKGHQISDPAIQLLYKHIYATTGCVLGTDQ